MNNQDTTVLNIKYAPEMRKLLAQAGGTDPSKEIEKFLNGFERLVNKIIPVAEGAIKNLGASNGLRFAVPNEYKQDVLDAVKTYIGSYELKIDKIINAGKTGTGSEPIHSSLATYEYSDKGKAFSEGTAVFSDMGSVEAYKNKVKELGGTTGRIRHNKKAHTWSVSYSVPNTFDGKEYAAGKLSNFAAGLSRGEEAEEKRLAQEDTETILAIREEEIKRAKRQKAINKILPIAWKNVQEDIAKKNAAAIEGYREAKDKQDSLDAAKERSSYFAKSLVAFGLIVSVTKRIYSVVSKLLEQALSTKYASRSTGIEANTLESMANALEGMGGDRNAAYSSANYLRSAFSDIGNLDSSALNKLGAVGVNVDSVLTMAAEGNQLGIMRHIMNTYLNKYKKGLGIYGDYVGRKTSLIQLTKHISSINPALGEFFEKLAGASDVAENTLTGNLEHWTGFGFDDFIKLIPATGVDAAANEALNWQLFKTNLEAAAKNIGRGVVGSPETPGPNALDVPESPAGAPPSVSRPKAPDTKIGMSGTLSDLVEMLDRYGIGYDRNGLIYGDREAVANAREAARLARISPMTQLFQNGAAYNRIKALLNDYDSYLSPMRQNSKIPGLFKKKAKDLSMLTDSMGPVLEGTALASMPLGNMASTVYNDNTKTINNGVDGGAGGGSFTVNVNQNGKPVATTSYTPGSDAYINIG